MKEKPVIEIGKTYHPKKRLDSDGEIVGSYWRAWVEGEKYYYEYDAGHFATKFKKVEISKEDFIMVKTGEMAGEYLRDKYSR